MTATDLDASVLSALDWVPALPCEHHTHDSMHTPGDPAAWLVSGMCPACGTTARYTLCESGKDLFMRPGVVFKCYRECGHIDTWGAFTVALERIRPGGK